MNWFKSFLALFGIGTASDSGGKNVVQEVADIADNRMPGEVTKHNMAVEDVKVGDASQASARAYEPAANGDGWFNKLVDAFNRLPRPVFATWAILVLFGKVQPPEWMNNPTPAQLIALNILWTIIGFYFGIRTITQDLPKLIKAIRNN